VCTKCGEVVIPPVFFDFDKDYLTATSVPVMLKVVEMVKKNPSIKKIVLHGHTDSKGSVKYNKGLSIRRVEHVYRFLHKNGLDVRVNKIYAWSENKPYTSNKTKDGRAQNRRVEFEIVR
jgi:outer membrane protein OmpA-like peptidoglycan-associated protein